MSCENLVCVKVKKRNWRTAMEMDLLIPGLPNEIAILCIARVPRASHRSMSGVSASWLSLLHGKEVSTMRHELLLAEDWLFVWTDVENAWRCFDRSLNKWSKLPAMPLDYRFIGTSAVASMDGIIYVIGGFLISHSIHESRYERASHSIPTKIVTSFNTRSYSWKRVADLNVARGHCMTAVIGNRIYAFGGANDRYTSRIAEAEVYDPCTDRWRLISSMLSPKTYGPTFVMGGKIYAEIEGQKGVMYDPDQDKWKRITNRLAGKWCTATVLNGKLYAGGEYLHTGNPHMDEDPPQEDHFIHVYNASRKNWVKVDDIYTGYTYSFIGNIELVTFCGSLCAVSVDSFGSETHPDFPLRMVVLDVIKLKGRPRCVVRSTGDFELRVEEGRCNPMCYKHCQVVAL